MGNNTRAYQEIKAIAEISARRIRRIFVQTCFSSLKNMLMLRGITKFTCDDCGNKFMGMDMEWNATAASCPVRCPKCGSMHTYPSGLDLLGLRKAFYREIWKSMDDRNKTNK